MLAFAAVAALGRRRKPALTARGVPWVGSRSFAWATFRTRSTWSTRRRSRCFSTRAVPSATSVEAPSRLFSTWRPAWRLPSELSVVVHYAVESRSGEASRRFPFSAEKGRLRRSARSGRAELRGRTKNRGYLPMRDGDRGGGDGPTLRDAATELAECLRACRAREGRRRRRPAAREALAPPGSRRSLGESSPGTRGSTRRRSAPRGSRATDGGATLPCRGSPGSSPLREERDAEEALARGVGVSSSWASTAVASSREMGESSSSSYFIGLLLDDYRSSPPKNERSRPASGFLETRLRALS